jgi:hypothetical protein
MELFTSALALTANTTAPPAHPTRTGTQPHLRPAAEWVRPEPTPSSYLDTAQEPVPWTTRSGPRPLTGARPQLAGEQRAMTSAFLLNPLRPSPRDDR